MNILKEYFDMKECLVERRHKTAKFLLNKSYSDLEINEIDNDIN